MNWEEFWRAAILWSLAGALLGAFAGAMSYLFEVAALISR